MAVRKPKVLPQVFQVGRSRPPCPATFCLDSAFPIHCVPLVLGSQRGPGSKAIWVKTESLPLQVPTAPLGPQTPHGQCKPRHLNPYPQTPLRHRLQQAFPPSPFHRLKLICRGVRRRTILASQAIACLETDHKSRKFPERLTQMRDSLPERPIPTPWQPLILQAMCPLKVREHLPRRNLWIQRLRLYRQTLTLPPFPVRRSISPGPPPQTMSL